MKETEATSFDRLVRLMRPPKSAIALVGAGVSRSVGYPTWLGLLDILHEKYLSMPQTADVKRRGLLPSPKYILQLKEMDDLTWRAQEYRRLLGATGFSSVLWETFRGKNLESGDESKEKVPTVLGELAKLNFRHILTTNYDPSLENKLNKDKDKWTVLEWTDREGIREFIREVSGTSSKRYFIYLHGTYNDPASIVLTERDYIERYVLNEEANRKLLAIFMTQPVVFIGFSMSDPALTYILRMVNAHLSPSFVDGELKPTNAQHFAILPIRSDQDEAAETRKFRGKYGIEPVFYELDQDEKHAALPLLLQKLRLAVESEPTGDEARTRADKRARSERRKTDPLDPHKGSWGGRAERNGRRLTAQVLPTAHSELYLVVLTVEATQPRRKPLKGTVTFHLHPTFVPDEETIPVEDGKAVYQAYAYGAFTVGVSADKGQTKLELDLSELESAPIEFRER